MAEAPKWIERTKDYINELRVEMRRVTWPSRKQVESTTTVVIISVFAFAAYFAVVDAVLKTGTDRLFKFFAK